MMVRNDPPIYSQNNNIPIVVGTQQDHTVQLLVRQLFTTRMVHLKPRVYVRPCTKYPTHGIKACVAKQGDTYKDRNIQQMGSIIFAKK
ncbi:hypothetical protein BpHYR1_041899 [Brachionus plicatilis]|uniref:Uncharacterized protein n=1 Tax=Brachionus plicatilis TaxID=10195 RepID=A0A3M7S199_BRAPC|nr:hypothetical protein BpHYR1_041899 [Brachionus plicatilis]